MRRASITGPLSAQQFSKGSRSEAGTSWGTMAGTDEMTRNNGNRGPDTLSLVFFVFCHHLGHPNPANPPTERGTALVGQPCSQLP